MRSIAADGFIEAVDRPRNGFLLRVLMGFLKALQDARQREADRLVADYQRPSRSASGEPLMTHFF